MTQRVAWTSSPCPLPGSSEGRGDSHGREGHATSQAHRELSDDELLAYLDEQLPVERMASIEDEMRASEALRQRFAQLLQRRDSGELSVGEVWRTNRLSCPTRGTLGSYLLRVLDDDLTDYIQFHLETIGCRYCQAVMDELQNAALDGTPVVERRQRKFYESSVGHLKKD